MSKYFQPANLAGAIAIVLTSTTTFAADQTIELDPIVVTASKSEEKASEVPARISVINEQTIQQSQSASLPDLLQQEAALNIVQSGGIGQSTSVFIRGTESDQTLVLKDGVRLNTASAGMASFNFLDASDLEHIEILKGPSSVLYGSDAIGGVIQLFTKIPTQNGAFITGEYGENNTYKTVVGGDFAQDGFYTQIRGQRMESDGTPVKNTLDAPDASYDQKGFSAKAGVDKQNYALGVEYSDNNGTSIYDNYGVPVSQDFKNQLLNITGRYNITDALALNARWSQFKDNLDQKEVNYLNQYDYVNTKRQEADLNVKWNVLPSQNILLGATIASIDVDSLSFGTQYNKSLDSNGYYIQHQYNNNGINTQLGIRLEDNDQFGTHMVGQGAIRYQLFPTTSIYANIGSAFRAPSGNDLYGYGGNSELNPEESISYEIGLDQKLNYNITTGISLYSTKVDDLINSICIADCNGWGVYQNYNVDKAKMQGGEVYAKWEGENLYVNFGYSYVRAKDESTGEDLSRRPRQKASLTAGWADNHYGLSTTLIGVSSSDNSSYDTVKIPGYMQMDVHTYFNINQYIKLFANVKNLWDNKFPTAYGSGSYYINGGREASIGVTLKY
ncbi:TonB-dependent receptor plug domain-containing protein [Acinetobacter puyangensis]|uniref:TonB-dependent receptor plug domain-containing protein n=1 Tax=Acinetobacter puyangensis TaxID=1096779 RepID=UPI003A4E4D4B